MKLLPCSLLFLALLFLICFLPQVVWSTDDDAYLGLFSVLPDAAVSASNPITEEKTSLGKKLFLDPMLSKSGDISCNSCHDLKTFGVDNKPTSPGHEGQLGTRNSPTVYNAALHTTQFWDGRAKDVEEQALGPILNPVEMAMPSGEEVIAKLKAHKDYVADFIRVFPGEADPINYDNVGKAIGSFERTLMTPGRFDTYIKGDKKALSPQEKAGLRVFVETGCTTCHMGPALGGLMLQKLGLVKPYKTEDLGRYEVTKSEADKYFFKVPGLRNIEKTGPYLHDGSITDLNQMIVIMADYQLGRKLSEEQVAAIRAFLGSLTGEIPERAL